MLSDNYFWMIQICKSKSAIHFEKYSFCVIRKKITTLQFVLRLLKLNFSSGIENFNLTKTYFLSHLTELPVWYPKVKFTERSKHDVKIRC